MQSVLSDAAKLWGYPALRVTFARQAQRGPAWLSVPWTSREGQDGSNDPSAGWSPLCSWLLSGAGGVQEHGGAAPGMHRSACSAWTLQPPSVSVSASPWCAEKTASATPLASLAPPAFAFSK